MSRQVVIPTQKSQPTRRDPKLFIIYSKPKAGKTTLVSTLPNNMILDLEEGTEYLEAMSMRIIGIEPPVETDEQFQLRTSNKDAAGRPKIPEYYLTEAGRAVMEAGRPYKFITLDTATKLEDFILPVAAKMYKATAIGKNWDGTDVREIAKGAGYLYMRLAYMDIIEKVKKLADNIILIGHVRDAVLEKQGKEVDSKDLDLTGKIKSIICTNADAIGYLYRGTKGELLINFKGTDEVVCGARPDHLKGQVIKIADYDETNNALTNISWHLIYPDTCPEVTSQ